jgi:hypothetical protein
MDIIVIAHRYKPYNRVGGIRWINLVEHLQKLDNTIHVVTVPRANNNSGDVVKVSKNLIIHYTKSDYFYKIFEVQHKEITKKLMAIGVQKLGSLVWYDDFAQHWYSDLKEVVVPLIEEYPKSVLIATGAPFQACYHLMRICKERKYNNYVLDFQDPWSKDPYRKYIFNWMKKKVEKFEETTIINSRNNVYVTNGLKDLMEYNNSNAIIIENGHDFYKGESKKDNGLYMLNEKVIKLLYLGTLANGRDEIFIDFLNKFENNTMIQLKLDVFGRVSRVFTNWVKQNNHHKIEINFKTPISRKAIPKISKNYQYGLQLNSQVYKYLVSTKIYEYPALGLPVLSINGGGEIESIIENNKIGLSININDINKIYLSEIVTNLTNVKGTSLTNFAQFSSWKSLAVKYNSYLNDLFK